MYVLGIDGGGTKTKGVIAHSDGTIVAEAIVGATNPNSVQMSEIKKELSLLIKTLSEQSSNQFAQIKRVFAGMSGVAHPSTKKEIQNLITSIVPPSFGVTVDNDAITALYSGTLGEPGIVQIAGTGSITYGVNNQGERGRVGGWGYLFGDEGSGYAIGRDGLRTAFRAYDGLENDPYLSNLLLHHFQVNNLPDIIPIIYQDQSSRELIASLSKLVVNAADAGNITAKNIIRENGFELGQSISCLINRLFTEEEVGKGIPVVLTGGLFSRLDLFMDSIEEIVYRNHLTVKIITPKMEPVGGAIIAALREENLGVINDFLIKYLKG